MDYLARVQTNVPDALKCLPNWVYYEIVPKLPKPSKVPFYLDNRFQHASMEWQKHTVSFDYITENYATAVSIGADGIGFCFKAGDNLVGIDLDDCLSVKNNKLYPSKFAKNILAELGKNVYVEKSISSTGIHIIGKCTKPLTCKSESIELYTSKRYFTVSGQVLKQFKANSHLQDITDLSESLIKSNHTDSTTYAKTPTDLLPVVPASTRHATMVAKAAEYARSSDCTSEASIVSYLEYVASKFKDADLFLRGGSRYQEITDAASWAMRERNKTDLPGDIDIEASVAAANSRIDTIAPQDTDLYMRAPGVIKEIMDEWMYYDHNPIPQFYFAAAISLLGHISAAHIRSSYMHTPPLDYMCCLARTGTGKSIVKASLLHTLSSLNHSNSVGQRMRSAQGLHLSIQNAPFNTFLLINDEAHHFFRAFRHKNVPAHIMQLMPLLLDLYDGHRNPSFDPGNIVTGKNILERLNRPKLGFLGFGTVDSMEDIFDAQALSDGLFNRFLTFVSDQELSANDAAPKTLPDQFDHIQTLQKYINTLQIDLQDHDSQYITIPYSTKALKHYTAYLRSINALRNAAYKAGNLPMDAILSRKVEHVGRLVVSLGLDKIYSSTVDWAIAMIDHIYTPILPHAKAVSLTETDRQYDDILRSLDRYCSRHKIPATARDVVRGIAGAKTYIVKHALTELTEAGEVVEVENYNRGTRGRKTTGYLPK